MAESPAVDKDPVRVVYHAEHRTFARLFKEHSLEDVKDVVRRKLGLGKDTCVSLKQIVHPDALLDLDDNDDFQAFRVWVRSSASVDIQVTVGASQGGAVPPAVGSALSVSAPVSPTKALVGLGQPGARPEAVLTAGASATPRAPETAVRKRKVSFGDAVLDKPGVTDGSSKAVVAVSPPKQASVEEPPKKKRKKERDVAEVEKAATRVKDVEPAEAVEKPSKKASDASKPKTKKATALDRASEAEASASKDAETQQPLRKSRAKKDDSTGPRKSSASVNPATGVDQSDSRASSPAIVTSIQSEKPGGSGVEEITSKIRKSGKAPKGTVCASIPQTSESTTVRSEVAAAILSGYQSKASETVPPEPPTKRRAVKKGIEKSSSSSTLSTRSKKTVDTVADEPPIVPTGHTPDNGVLIDRPPQELSGPPCPICLEVPFHIRYCCPTVLKGSDAIHERLEELKKMSMGGQQSVIKELEGLLRDSKVTPSLDAAPSDDIPSREASPLRKTALPDIPNISYLSEVTVESRNEGSSSESSDDMSEDEAERKGIPRRTQTPEVHPPFIDDDLETITRGPAPKQQSILRVLDRIVGDEEDKDSDSEEDTAELEQDPDEETSWLGRRLAKRTAHSSDSESEEEGSKSASRSRSPEHIPNRVESSIRGSKPVAASTKHQDKDVAMEESVDPPAFEGQDDGSSEETHVGSEDRMVVDESNGEKDVVVIVEERPLSPVKPHASEGEGAGPVDQVDEIPAASGDPIEVDADPIEPADELAVPTIQSSNVDSIELSSEDIPTLSISTVQLTAKAGVAKRIKTRGGQIPDDDAEGPVLVEELAMEATDETTPLSMKGKSRAKDVETPVTRRKSPRFSSLPSSHTPAAVMLLNHRTQSAARNGKAGKTPAKRTEGRLDGLQSGSEDVAYRARLPVTPSLAVWETLAEPESLPSQLDEPLDELISSPYPDDVPARGRTYGKERKGRPRKSATTTQAEDSQGKERLFEPSSSQIPFPYSQKLNDPAQTMFPDGHDGEETTDSDKEKKMVPKKQATTPYRPLSQLSRLASQSTLFSPGLPAPTTKSATNGKAKKRVVEQDSSSSSSSSDSDEAAGSEHIPRGRRAGQVPKKRNTRVMV